MNIDWYLSQASSERQALLAELTHEYLLSMIPNCRVKRKYGIPFYKYRKDLCYMNFFRKRPYVSFLQGRNMMASTMLEKTKKSKYAKYYINSEKDIYKDDFAQVILEAITIQDELFKL